MNLPEPDDDLDIPCVICGVRAELAPVRYVYDPISLAVVAFCDVHYRNWLITVHGEDVAVAILQDMATEQPT